MLLALMRMSRHRGARLARPRLRLRVPRHAAAGADLPDLLRPRPVPPGAAEAWGLWAFFREPYWCAILALTLNTAAYASEIIRGGLQAVPRAQIEAARACGMSGFLLFRRIVFPIAVRQALPGLRQRDHPDGQGDLARLDHHA